MKKRPSSSSLPWRTLTLVLIAVVIVTVTLNKEKNTLSSSSASAWNTKQEPAIPIYTLEAYHRDTNRILERLLEPALDFEAGLHHDGYPPGLTMMNREMLDGLRQQVESVVDAGIEGDVYEFGSWRGGASMWMACVFSAYERLKGKSNNHPKRHFWVFDTFDGFSAKQLGNDQLLKDLLQDKYWKAPVGTVKKYFVNLTSPEFVQNQVHFVPGLFEDSVPTFQPQNPIALLRLDGDLYQSTMVVLQHLYPAVQRGGEVIVDDYDWNPERWAKGAKGRDPTRKLCKHAVDEYRRHHGIDATIIKSYGRPSWTKQERMDYAFS